MLLLTGQVDISRFPNHYVHGNDFVAPHTSKRFFGDYEAKPQPHYIVDRLVNVQRTSFVIDFVVIVFVEHAHLELVTNKFGGGRKSGNPEVPQPREVSCKIRHESHFPANRHCLMKLIRS